MIYGKQLSLGVLLAEEKWHLAMRDFAEKMRLSKQVLCVCVCVGTHGFSAVPFCGSKRDRTGWVWQRGDTVEESKMPSLQESGYYGNEMTQKHASKHDKSRGGGSRSRTP